MGLRMGLQLGQEPRRMWKRYLFTNSMFAIILSGTLLRRMLAPGFGRAKASQQSLLSFAGLGPRAELYYKNLRAHPGSFGFMTRGLQQVSGA